MPRHPARPRAAGGLPFNRLRTQFGIGQIEQGTLKEAVTETARLKAPLGLNVSALQRSGMALFLGASTALGPAYVGVGLGQGGQKTAYLFLGRP